MNSFWIPKGEGQKVSKGWREIRILPLHSPNNECGSEFLYISYTYTYVSKYIDYTSGSKYIVNIRVLYELHRNSACRHKDCNYRDLYSVLTDACSHGDDSVPVLVLGA